MSKMLASLGGNAGAVVAGGGMVAAIALGAYIGLSPAQETPAVVATLEPAVSDPASTQSVTETKPADTPAVVVDVPKAPEPTFDELRRETDGTTIIAGRAEPLSEVNIIVDGTEVATTTADSSGGFAAIAVLPPKETAQVVSLTAQTDDAEEPTASADEIILAPAPSSQTVTPEPTTEVASLNTDVETPSATIEGTLPQPAEAEVVEPSEEAPTQVAAAETQAEPEPEAEPAPARVAVLKSDAEGVRLINTAPPEAMTSVALDTIGYSDLGDVQLTGRAQPDTAQVRVYLDNRSVITLPVDAEGRWRGDLPNVDAGVYTLRVDEVTPAGAVSSRVETPFKRESAAVLAGAAASEGPVKSITVQTGATLWAIARERYGDGTLYLRVVEANAASIRDPDLIYPGQVFDLPN